MLPFVFLGVTTTIRSELRPGDLAYILQAHHRHYYPDFGYGAPFEAIVAGALAETYALTEGKRTRWWIVEGEGRRQGSLVLLDRGEAAQLRFFFLEPGARGQGIGKQLLDAFLHHLQTHHFRSAYLWTTASQQTACGLYAHYGFRITERQETTTFGVLQEELKYELHR